MLRALRRRATKIDVPLAFSHEDEPYKHQLEKAFGETPSDKPNLAPKPMNVTPTEADALRLTNRSIIPPNDIPDSEPETDYSAAIPLAYDEAIATSTARTATARAWQGAASPVLRFDKSAYSRLTR